MVKNYTHFTGSNRLLCNLGSICTNNIIYGKYISLQSECGMSCYLGVDGDVVAIVSSSVVQPSWIQVSKGSES